MHDSGYPIPWFFTPSPHSLTSMPGPHEGGHPAAVIPRELESRTHLDMLRYPPPETGILEIIKRVNQGANKEIDWRFAKQGRL